MNLSGTIRPSTSHPDRMLSDEESRAAIGRLLATPRIMPSRWTMAKRRLADWWRGYSVSDLRSLSAKLEQAKEQPPGALTMFTNEEMKALKAMLER